MLETNKIYQGDCLEILKGFPDRFLDCCVTSPPYFALRDYGNEKQIGLEDTPELYIEKLKSVFHEVKRVLKDDGTLWINVGDSYAGGSGRWGGMENLSEMQKGSKGSLTEIQLARKWKHDVIKPKDLIGIPWMLAFALRGDGWFLRQDIIWHKPNPMPESVTDRFTKSHEYLFLFSKSSQYYFDNESVKENSVCKDDRRNGLGRIAYEGERASGADAHAQQSFVTVNEKRNKRDVWTVNVKPIKDAHFATYPEELIEPCILAGCRENGIVLDPFFGSGTTGRVAEKLNRQWVGIELNESYVEIASRRTNNIQKPLFI